MFLQRTYVSLSTDEHPGEQGSIFVTLCLTPLLPVSNWCHIPNGWKHKLSTWINELLSSRAVSSSSSSIASAHSQHFPPSSNGMGVVMFAQTFVLNPPVSPAPRLTPRSWQLSRAIFCICHWMWLWEKTLGSHIDVRRQTLGHTGFWPWRTPFEDNVNWLMTQLLST